MMNMLILTIWITTVVFFVEIMLMFVKLWGVCRKNKIHTQVYRHNIHVCMYIYVVSCVLLGIYTLVSLCLLYEGVDAFVSVFLMSVTMSLAFLHTKTP